MQRPINRRPQGGDEGQRPAEAGEGREAQQRAVATEAAAADSATGASAAAAAGDAAAEGTILGPLGAEALAGIASVAAGFAGATAAFGLLFIPSPNEGAVSRGAVPGEPRSQLQPRS